MLKDVYDSKRINHHLYSDPTSNLSSNNLNNKLEFPVRAIIVSNQFWPNFKDNFNVELPSVIQNHLDNYTKAFESFKVSNIGKIYYTVSYSKSVDNCDILLQKTKTNQSYN